MNEDTKELIKVCAIGGTIAVLILLGFAVPMSCLEARALRKYTGRQDITCGDAFFLSFKNINVINDKETCK